MKIPLPSRSAALLAPILQELLSCCALTVRKDLVIKVCTETRLSEGDADDEVFVQNLPNTSVCMPILHQSSAASLSRLHLLIQALQELMVTAVRAVTGEASSHLLCGSDAHSEGSAAGPASDNAAADEPLHANHSNNSDYSSPQTDRQAAQASRRVLESAPCSPCKGLLSQPRPPCLQRLSLNVNGLRERQKRAALFAVLQAEP